jgi:lipopolysaccharide transport system ATP-binding protein
MTKIEIKSKFDEIVDFSGVERYIDTPVKRYSSGMYVRLAFAVAAHLESEILIVDEVLAVGDAEFQKKCLGKMKSVSGQGRTVLFVSHNMPAVKNLCTKGILIERGTVKMFADINSIVSSYLTKEEFSNVWRTNSHDLVQSQIDKYKVISISARNINGNVISEFSISRDYIVEIEFEVMKENSSIGFSLVFSDNEGTCLFGSLNNTEPNYYGKKLGKGKYKASCKIDGNLFNNIDLVISLIVFGPQWTDSYIIENALKIKGVDDGLLKGDYYGEYGGFFRPKLKWLTIKEE